VREDWKVKETWEDLAEHYRKGTLTKSAIDTKCSEEGVSRGTLDSPVNIFWDLYSFEVARQLMVDAFHNLPEGHGNILCNLFSSFTPAAEVVVERVWNDPQTWDALKKGKL